jgi:hypothetical protein
MLQTILLGILWGKIEKQNEIYEVFPSEDRMRGRCLKTKLTNSS